MKEKEIKDYALKHSTSHLMASAVKELYPKAKLAIGPPTEDGFYYDFDNLSIADEDLKNIEKKMRQLAEQNHEFKVKDATKKEAEKLLKEEPYKLEILKDLKGKITFYSHGNFNDLCEGPHVKSTKEIKNFKLTKLAGAYWRGDSKNKMLTRIYGVTFKTEKELKDYLQMVEEAKKRDHVILGKKLKLFLFHETSPGSPYWLPKGVILLNELIKFWREEHEKRGYHEIISPIINKKELWLKSGHWEHFKDDMFIADMGKNEVYGIKPMNCPNAMIVFSSEQRSYRDLPLRLSDTDTLHRYELSGTLHGLLRVRAFRQDDSHNFITEDDIESEYKEIFSIVKKFYDIFGLDYKYRLGTKPEKFLGDKATWDKAERALNNILTDTVGKENYAIAEGDGAFYGPKVDILIKDALGREWQMGTIQLDFQIPKCFDLTYTAKDGTKKTPIVVHRVIYGSLERFIGMLIEHTAGNFPLWLNPEQVRIMAVTDKNNKYAEEIYKKLKEAGLRVSFDKKPNSIGKKVREAQIEKINYMVTIGDKEEEKKTIAIRTRDGKVSFDVKLESFIKELRKEIEDKR